ncbi:MAG: hypothetical protein PUD59_01540 [bacterium]|nr:hypothetical protein [bacterium]
MKNVINYYYDFYISDLKLINDDYWFEYNNNKFCFHNVKHDINIQYSIALLKKIKIDKISSVILNKNNSFITTSGNDNYILLKMKIKNNRKIKIDDILLLKNYYIDNSFINFSKFEWNQLWSKKIDFFEYYISQNPKMNDNIKCLLHYFIGLGENSILYFEKTLSALKKSDFFNQLSICHNRVSINDTLYDFYNPFNFVIDYKVRDLSEYLKSMFFNNYSYFDYEEVLNKFNYSKIDYMLLFSRLMFPTFFFDMLNSLEIKKISENQIIELYDSAEKFEIFLKDIYEIISKKVQIPYIDWLN